MHTESTGKTETHANEREQTHIQIDKVHRNTQTHEHTLNNTQPLRTSKRGVKSALACVCMCVSLTSLTEFLMLFVNDCCIGRTVRVGLAFLRFRSLFLVLVFLPLCPFCFDVLLGFWHSLLWTNCQKALIN